MALKPLVGYQGPKFGVEAVPSLTVSTGHARNAEQTAAVTAKIAGLMADDLDRTAVRQAKRTGIIAGATGVPELKDDDTLSGSAFNDAAMSTYTNRVELNARAKLIELEATHKANPLEFKKAVEGYKAGVMGEMSSLTPELAPLFGAQFDALAGSSLAKIVATKNDLIAEDQKAVALRIADVLEKGLTDLAPDLMSKDVATATGAFNNITLSTARLGTVLNQKRADGMPLFKASEREKMLIDFEDAAMDMAVRGYIDASPSKFAALKELNAGRGRVRLNVFDEKTQTATVQEFDVFGRMTRQQREKAMSYAVAQANAESHALNAQEVAATRLQRATEDQTFKEVVNRFGAGKLTEQFVNDNRGSLNPEDFKAAKIMALGGGTLVDDDLAVQELEGALHDQGTARTLARNLLNEHRITRETFISYTQRSATMEANRSPTSEYKQLTGMLDGLSKQAASITSDVGAMQFPVIGASFDRWWQTFKDQPDPRKPGETMGRAPTYEEGQAKILQLFQQRLPTGIGAFEKAFLGVNVPPMSITVPTGQVDKTGKPINSSPMPLAVRDPATGRLDVTATAINLDKAFNIKPGTPVEQYPQAYREEALRLKRYHDATRGYFDILERIGTNGRR